jgi:hypothetical protein
MGNPLHFSLEVPKRAHQLLRDLYEHLGESDGTRLPLKATFLLSVSMPIVILPIERILKYRRNANSGRMDDAVLNPKLADAVDHAICRLLSITLTFSPASGSSPSWIEGHDFRTLRRMAYLRRSPYG